MFHSSLGKLSTPRPLTWALSDQIGLPNLPAESMDSQFTYQDSSIWWKIKKKKLLSKRRSNYFLFPFPTTCFEHQAKLIGHQSWSKQWSRHLEFFHLSTTPSLFISQTKFHVNALIALGRVSRIAVLFEWDILPGFHLMECHLPAKVITSLEIILWL